MANTIKPRHLQKHFARANSLAHRALAMIEDLVLDLEDAGDGTTEDADVLDGLLYEAENARADLREALDHHDRVVRAMKGEIELEDIDQ